MHANTDPIDVDSPPLPSGASQLPTTLACLARPVPSITPDLTVDAVGALFRRMRRLHDLPVVQNGIPVGLVRRMDFMDIYLSQYGRDLYSRKPIALFMDSRPTILEDSTRLEDASRVITARADRHASSQAFIITQERRYLGLAWTMDLLEKITDLRRALRPLRQSADPAARQRADSGAHRAPVAKPAALRGRLLRS